MEASYICGGEVPVSDTRVSSWREPLIHMLRDAERFVMTERNGAYGDPYTNHVRIARLWNEWLTKGGTVPMPDAIQPHDAAMMMDFVKVARLMETPDHDDSIADKVGYAMCYKACIEGER